MVTCRSDIPLHRYTHGNELRSEVSYCSMLDRRPNYSHTHGTAQRTVASHVVIPVTLHCSVIILTDMAALPPYGPATSVYHL